MRGLAVGRKRMAVGTGWHAVSSTRLWWRHVAQTQANERNGRRSSGLNDTGRRFRGGQRHIAIENRRTHGSLESRWQLGAGTGRGAGDPAMVTVDGESTVRSLMAAQIETPASRCAKPLLRRIHFGQPCWWERCSARRFAHTHQRAGRPRNGLRHRAKAISIRQRVTPAWHRATETWG